MKIRITFVFLFFCPVGLFAQNIQRPNSARTPVQPKPLPIRQVSGIVKDSTDQTVIGATVALLSAHDTLRVSTNADGIFVFKAVKAPEFTLTITSLGYRTYVKKFFYPYTTARLVLDPVILKTDNTVLDPVKLNGTPTITYKTDTVEYRASDYKVRENATMEDLIKKMEGIEVDKDGNVTAQGIAVTRARINGQNYMGNDLAGVIRDLPADIAEKVQIIDDYGDEAALTGVKQGDPQKVLNIVTKQNRSVGNRGRLAAGKGTNGRVNGSLNGNRFNGNQQIGLQSNVTTSVIGVASSGNNGTGGSTGGGGGGNGGNNGGNGGRGGGGTGGTGTTVVSGNGFNTGGGGTSGTRTNGRAGFTYNDLVNAKLRIETSYNYNYSKNNSSTSSLSSEPYNNIGTIFASREGNTLSNSSGHNIDTRFQYTPDSTNYFIITPVFNSNSSTTNTANKNFQTGALHQDYNSSNGTHNAAPTYGLTINYSHRFAKTTSLSAQVSTNHNDNNAETDNNNNILYYDDTQGGILSKDSLIHRLNLRDNVSRSYRGSLTFSQRLGTVTRLELNSQINYRGYDNNQTITNIINQSAPKVIDSLSKIFDYSFTESRLTLNYRRGNNITKFNYSLGLSGVPGLLRGTSQSLGNTTSRRSFNLIPVARVEYKWSRTTSLSVNYSGNPNEPSYNQIQDVPDASTPTNIIYGNPNLKASFRHNVQGNFNKYIAASKVTLQAGATVTYNDNQVVTNSISYRDTILSGGKQLINLQRETRYLNLNGTHSYRENYSINKTVKDALRLRLNGDVIYNHGISMNNGFENESSRWTFNERFGLQITPKEWLEINPTIGHTYAKAYFSLPTSIDSRTKNLDLSLDGRFIIHQKILFGYDLNKNFVSGLNPTITRNPFIVNSYITKEFFKRKNGSITLRASDLFNQNIGSNKVITESGGVIETKSNLNSRYFTLNLNWAPQKWTGGRRAQGPRRGDGSFIPGR